jgi:hypothetical protein
MAQRGQVQAAWGVLSPVVLNLPVGDSDLRVRGSLTPSRRLQDASASVFLAGQAPAGAVSQPPGPGATCQ